MQSPIIRTGLGKSSRRFLPEDSSKSCFIGGIQFEGVPGLDHDSDGDVLFHAVCNAITSLTHVPILGGIALDLLRKDGYTDSSLYVQAALNTLKSQQISYVSIALEGKRPLFQEKIKLMRKKVSEILSIQIEQIGITVSSGDGLSDYGCGDGVQCICIITTTEAL
jgi:2-C-methyl-D-erythritol 2,4-cyclodiphosphate synthase